MVNRRLGWLAGVVLLWGRHIPQNRFAAGRASPGVCRLARARQEVATEIPAPRGAIFDRMGQPLALSVPGKSVYIDPPQMVSPRASDLLSRLLTWTAGNCTPKWRMRARTIAATCWWRAASRPRSMELIRKSARRIHRLREARSRHYPNGRLAAHVLGSVDFGEMGDAGIEKALDGDLRGIPGTDWT